MIGRIGPGARQAIPDLKVALKDDLLRTAAEASILLIDPNDLDARKSFFEAARKGDDPFVVVDTIRRLGWRDEETTKVLQEMLKQHEHRVRIVAGGLLLRINPEMEQAQEAFREGFGDSFDGIRNSYEVINDDWSAALCILREVPATMKLALPIAVEKLSDEYRREGAREALIAMSQHRKFDSPELLNQLDAARLDLRLNAIEAFSLLRPETTEVVSHLLAKLDDPRPALRAEAAKALGNIRRAEAPVVDVLINRLKDEYATVRVNAAYALAQLGPAAKSAKSGLTALYHDESKPVRDAAVRAVAAIEK
jgi:HEAT repeat protein